jgi:periplasmic divalent cation tolerance protein
VGFIEAPVPQSDPPASETAACTNADPVLLVPALQVPVLLVLVTCADEAEAIRIGHALVQRRLAACVHLRPHQAIYRWQGRIERAAEFTLLAKTTAARFAALRDAVLALHSYDLPAILAVPVTDGHQPFLAWVAAETTTPEGDAPPL